jgi:hypothetical protein
MNRDLVHRTIANSWEIIIYYEYFKIITNIQNSFQEHQAAHKHAAADPDMTSACQGDDACYGFIFALLAVDGINIV